MAAQYQVSLNSLTQSHKNDSLRFGDTQLAENVNELIPTQINHANGLAFNSLNKNITTGNGQSLKKSIKTKDKQFTTKIPAVNVKPMKINKEFI